MTKTPDPTAWYEWRLSLDTFLSHLLDLPNKATRRGYRGDLRAFRLWLCKRGFIAPDLAAALALLLSCGRGQARALAQQHATDMLGSGDHLGTANRRLSTLRRVARVARYNMRKIDWDLQDVPNLKAITGR